jgi:hypothetical protein
MFSNQYLKIKFVPHRKSASISIQRTTAYVVAGGGGSLSFWETYEILKYILWPIYIFLMLKQACIY